MPPLSGRSWVEGDIEVVGFGADCAAAAYAGSSSCHSGNGRVFFWGRGGGCEGGAADKGRAINVNDGPPGEGLRRE